MSHIITHKTFNEKTTLAEIQSVGDHWASCEDWAEGCTGLYEKVRLFNNHICKDYEEAEKFLEDHDHTYAQIGVKYRVYPDRDDSKTEKDLKDRIKIQKDKMRSYAAAHSIQTFKSKLIGCPNCGSKLNREYLEDSQSCPLCGTDLRGKTTLDTIQRYKENISDLYKRLETEGKKQDAKNVKKSRIEWLVKFECHV